jgi:phospholipase/carboxylesterase
MMDEQTQSFISQIDGWTFRIKHPSQKPEDSRVLLLIHGHLGNENVMWILANPLPQRYTLIAPRAPIKLGESQYSWHTLQPQWPGLDYYEELTAGLLGRVDAWVKSQELSISRYDIMGFSQGGVMAYALAILQPSRIGQIAAIASFIPHSWKPLLDENTLRNRQFFIAHGTEDEIIPVKKARQASQWLREKGADVTFCTAKTGHKISANCFKGLGDFFYKARPSATAD